MTLAEATQELTDIKAAINRIQGTASQSGSQEYSTGSLRFVRAPLETLYKRRDYLEVMVSRLTKGGAVTNPIFGTRV